MSKFKRFSLALATSAILLVGCGSNADESPSGTGISAVKVMGDSLSDSGVFGSLGVGSTYGRIFSVQASPGVSSQIWTERLADLFGVPALCNFYTFTGTTFTSNIRCGSFAVGGGRINNRYKAAPDNADPFSIPKQIAAASALGNFKSTDLLLIDGGGNDAADLVSAYLGATADRGAAFSGIVTTAQSMQTDIGAALTANNLPTAGTLYMQALADEFYASIKTNALDKGATHVAVLSVPVITKTPKFQAVLAGVEASAGATTRANVETLVNSWVQTFNARLATQAQGDTRVVVGDFYAELLQQVTNPSKFGLTNVTTPACPQTGTDTSSGLPIYNFETCTAASLSATAGKSSPDWWKTYAFSDGFHPTPYGHQLMSQLMARSLTQAGWMK